MKIANWVGEMWFGPYLDRWDERQAAEDDGNKVVEPLVIDAASVFSDLGDGATLAELAACVARHREKSCSFFSSEQLRPVDYIRQKNLLRFPSAIVTETKTNNTVNARIYEAANIRQAIVVLPHWNASMWAYHSFSQQLRRIGFTTVEVTLPYHGCRNREAAAVSDYFLSANLGRTIRSVKQAVLDTRRVIDWLFQQQYANVGLIGISLGSCVAGLVAAHDCRIRRSALVLTAGDFAEVVWTGRATRHIRSALASEATLAQIQNVWSIIATESFVSELARAGHQCLIVSGRRDQVVKPYLTERFVKGLRAANGNCRWHTLECGHYSLGRLPFSVWTFLLLARFFRSKDLSHSVVLGPPTAEGSS